MNLLIIGQDFSPSFLERLKIYGKYFNKIFVISYAKGKGYKKFDFRNIEIHLGKSASLLTFPLRAYLIAKNIVENNKIDAVYTQDPLFCGIVGYLIKKKYSLPFIAQVHGDYIDNTYWIKEKHYRYLLNIMGKYILKKADGIRVVSKEIKKKMIRIGVRERKIFIIPLVVNLNKFKTPDKNLVKSLKEKYKKYTYRLIFVGRLAPEKNLFFLITSFKIVLEKKKNGILLIIGDGKLKEKLEKYVKQLNIEKHVKFLGFINHDDLPPYYHIADALILPSYYEGRATVLIEALASELPVIATNVSGTKEVVINGKTGYIVEINDIYSLSKAILTVIDKKINLKLRKNIKKHFKIPSLEENAHQQYEMIKNIILSKKVMQ